MTSSWSSPNAKKRDYMQDDGEEFTEDDSDAALESPLPPHLDPRKVIHVDRTQLRRAVDPEAEQQQSRSLIEQLSDPNVFRDLSPEQAANVRATIAALGAGLGTKYLRGAFGETLGGVAGLLIANLLGKKAFPTNGSGGLGGLF